MSVNPGSEIEAPKTPCPRCGTDLQLLRESWQTTEEIEGEYFWDVPFAGEPPAALSPRPRVRGSELSAATQLRSR